MSGLTEVIARLRALRMHVTVSTEDLLDAAVCALTDTSVPYRNPHYEHEIGWIKASGLSADKGHEILTDIKTVCDELEKRLTSSAAPEAHR